MYLLNMIPEQYNILWAGSWIALYPTLLSIYNKKFGLSIATGSVVVTSLLYWRKPENNWKRILDVNVVKLCLLYQIYSAYNQNKLLIFTGIDTISIILFYYGYYRYYIKKDYWSYTYIHFTFHFIANIGNFYLALN